MGSPLGEGQTPAEPVVVLVQTAAAAARDPRVRVFSIGELKPTRSAGTPDALPRFVSSITRVLAASAS